MAGCISNDYTSKEGGVQFPIIVDMDSYCYVMSGDGNIDLRRDDGEVFHGDWDMLSNDAGHISFRVDFAEIDAYPATLTIFGDNTAELWITGMSKGAKVYGEWR